MFIVTYLFHSLGNVLAYGFALGETMSNGLKGTENGNLLGQLVSQGAAYANWLVYQLAGLWPLTAA